MVYTVCISQSDQGLQYLPFSAFWSGPTLFAILSLFRVYTICHSQHSYQGVHYIYHSFQADLARSTLFAILICMIKVYTICNSQSDQGVPYMPFSAFWSGSTLFAILSKHYYQGSTLFAILSLFRVYTICHSQHSYQGVHYIYHFFQADLARSTLFVILSSMIRVYTICNSQSDQSLQYLLFSAVLSVSTVIAILSSLIRIYSTCHSQQVDQCLHYLPFSAVWSWSTLFAALSSLI